MEKKQYVPPIIILYRVAMEKGIADTPMSVQETINAEDWVDGGIVGEAPAERGNIWLPL